MKNNTLKLLVLPILSLFLFACASNSVAPETPQTDNGNNNEPSSNQDGEPSNQDPNQDPNNNDDEDNGSTINYPLNPMDEPYIARQYYLNHVGDIYNIWNFYRGKGTTIAVIDSGFNPYHEDFYYEDGTSKVSDKSASFVTDGNQTTTEIGVNKVINMADSHGTFCAGVAAAAVNGKGVAGIAPEASLLLLKTDKKPKSIAKAFKYAADNGATAITISIGSYYNYDGDLVNDGSDLGTVFDEPVKYCYDKNIPVISAGGNGGFDNPTEFTFPGCVDYVIGCGGLAANSSTEIWEGSSYNSSPEWQSIDVFAPSDMMFGCCHYDNKKYDSGWNGTSFASPIVAGLAALYFQKYPGKTVSEFENDLIYSCHALPEQNGIKANQLGHGRVDAGKLIGLTFDGRVKASIKTNWTDVYAYVWNSVTGTKQSNWPGTKLNKEAGTFAIWIESSQYDSVIFTASNSGPQTPDLLATSFIYGDCYDLTSPIQETNMNYVVGVYQ